MVNLALYKFTSHERLNEEYLLEPPSLCVSTDPPAAWTGVAAAPLREGSRYWGLQRIFWLQKNDPATRSAPERGATSPPLPPDERKHHVGLKNGLSVEKGVLVTPSGRICNVTVLFRKYVNIVSSF